MFNLKNISILIFIIFLGMTSSFARPVNEVYGGVSEGQMIYYSFFTKKWYYQRPNHLKSQILEVTRYVEDDLGVYSKYVSPNKDIYSPDGSTYEFIYKGRLLAYHSFENKFYEIFYHRRNKIFIEIPLNISDIRKITGKPQIIYISDFVQDIDENYNLEIKKFPLKRQSYLLLNDTDLEFVNYELDTAEKDRLIKTLFSTKRPVNVKFYDTESEEDSPSFFIKIKNGI